MENPLQLEIQDFIRKTRWAMLATVREDRAPAMRVMGSFVPDGWDLLFSTSKHARKVSHIAANPSVCFHFQHEGQEPSRFSYVCIVGGAAEVTEPAELQRAIELLGAKSARLRSERPTVCLSTRPFTACGPRSSSIWTAPRGPRSAAPSS